MHEVAAAPLISEVRVGLSRARACASGWPASDSSNSFATGAASIARGLAGTEVRVVPIERVVDRRRSIIEIQVPFDRLGARAGSDLQFAIQVRDRSDAILETVPHGRFWTVAIPAVGVDSRRLASLTGHPPGNLNTIRKASTGHFAWQYSMSLIIHVMLT